MRFWCSFLQEELLNSFQATVLKGPPPTSLMRRGFDLDGNKDIVF